MAVLGNRRGLHRACLGWESPRLERARRCALLAVALLGLLALLRGLAPAIPATPDAASVALIVLDTVRADRLSLCGYPRPTSATLERLRDEGASFSCGGVVPGSWTLPVHASFFTGLDVAAHAADFARSPHGGGSAACLDVLCGDADPGAEVADLFGSIAAHPLPPEAETLAEHFRGLGYQTVLVSGNPVVSSVTGLAQGFDHVVSPRRFAELEGARLVRALESVLGDLDRSGSPLFLTVNITEAHQPYEAVPSGVAWLPPREAIHYFLPQADPWTRFVSGEMA
ncbi:MAG: sulfatase-like hydrolase/transferase, partial [Gammaproteobacteria bacterium]